MPGCRQRRRPNWRRCCRTGGSQAARNISFNNAFTKPWTALSVRANVARSGGTRRHGGVGEITGWTGMGRPIQLELLPHERAALLKWNLARDEVRDQLQACAASPDTETITIDSVDLHWLASDLTHAIVKGGCRDDDILDLSERLDYVDDTSDGSLDGWY